jgi:acyl carrier protein
MTHMPRPDLATEIIALIADTFDLPGDTISIETRPGEIAGWDSLGHSVLLTRVARRFRVTVTEDLATPVANVAELVAHIGQAARRVQNA